MIADSGCCYCCLPATGICALAEKRGDGLVALSCNDLGKLTDK